MFDDDHAEILGFFSHELLSETKIEKWYILYVRMVAKTTWRKKTNGIVIEELVKSLKENDNIEEGGLDAKADTITDSLEADRIIKRYKEIVKTQNKRAINYVGKLGQLLQKFKWTHQFPENVGQSKPTIHFKIGLYKLLKRQPEHKKFTLTFNYFQKNFIVMCKK